MAFGRPTQLQHDTPRSLPLPRFGGPLYLNDLYGRVSAGLAFLLLGGAAVARIFWSISVTQGLAGIIAAEALVVTLLVGKARGAPSSGGAAP